MVTANLTLGLVLVLAGCDGDRSPDATVSPPPAGASASSTSPQEAAKAKALAAYIGMWQAMARAGQVADPDAPALRQHADGDALRGIVAALVTYHETGVVTRGAPVLNPRVDSLYPPDEPTEANVVDCADSSNWTKHKKSTGELVSADPRGRRRITALVRLIGDAWKVARFDTGDIGSC
jgi:hypothetical protein